MIPAGVSVAHNEAMPKPRKRLVSLSVTPYYHCISRCVRRAYLCGVDTTYGYDYEHRRQWIVSRMELLASVFAIDLCAYAVMSNHYHVVVRMDIERCKALSNREVAKHWLSLFKAPELVKRWLRGELLHRAEMFVVEALLGLWRRRLCDLSWFMRCLNEHIARRANEEDHCTGRFWEGRFKSQALLDERALLSCMAYVDLNPIRAGIAQTPETSDYTSIQQRISQPSNHHLLSFRNATSTNNDIPYAHSDYLQLVDWAGRAIRTNDKGVISEAIPPILERLNVAYEPLIKFLANKQLEPVNALGPASRIRDMAASLGMKFLRGVSLGKQLYPEPG